MSERLADIAVRIDNVRQLDAVVTAMRGIAAARAQQSRGLLAGIEAYAATISGAIGQALNFAAAAPPPLPERRPRGRVLILFVAEHGFAGAFSDRVLDAAQLEIAGSHLMMVGTRGAAIARERGIAPDWTIAMASQIAGVPAIANRIADALYMRIVNGLISQAETLFPHMDAGHNIVVERRALFPLDLERFRQPQASLPPLTTLEPQILIERLVAEYIYARLCEAAMHAFAAENQARMEAMSAATNNIERNLGELKLQENQMRQEEVTAEIIELAGEAAAMWR